MRQAFVSLRYTPEARRAVVLEGLRRVGYSPVDGLTRDPSDGDMMLSWNRIGTADECARIFTDRGLPVLVMENSSYGSNSFAGKNFYHVASRYHNVRGCFPIGGPERWDSLGVELAPWRTEGERIVLPSRGFGPAHYRMPANWPRQQRGRIRPHPGRFPERVKPLREDLSTCAEAVTWGSAAGIVAAMMGVRVTSCMPDWIGAHESTDADRLRMLRELSCAQWTIEEIYSGEPFDKLLRYGGGR